MVESRAMTSTVFDAAVLAQGELLGEQGVDGPKRSHFAALEASYRRVEDLDGARHLEPDHGLLDTVDHGGNDLNMGAVIARLPGRRAGGRRPGRSRASGGQPGRRRGG